MDYDRLRELQEKFEENPRRYFAPLANEYRKGGQPKRAIEICRAQLAQMPGHMSGQIVFGQALYEAGEFEEARKVFETALTLDPENLIALRTLGDMSLQSGNTVEARRWYTRLLDADPKDTAVIALVSEIDASADAAPIPTPQSVPIDEDAGDQQIPFIADAEGTPIQPELQPEVAAPGQSGLSAPSHAAEATHAPATKPAASPPPPQSAAPQPAAGPARAPEPEPVRPEPEPAAPPAEVAPPPGLERHYPEPVRLIEPLAPTPRTLAAIENDIPLGAEGLHSAIQPPDPTAGLHSVLEPREPTGAEGLQPRARPAHPQGTEGLKGKPPVNPLAAKPAGQPEEETPLDNWTPPPGANVHDTAPASKDERMFSGPGPEPFVNETMAQLYLQQGYRQLALKVYYQLAEARPNDQGLKDRIAEIEAADRAAHPEVAEARREPPPIERPSAPPAPRSPSVEAPTPSRAPESEESPSFDRTPIDSPPSRPSRERESVESPGYDEPRAEPEGIAARQPSIREFFATLGRRRPPRAGAASAGGGRSSGSFQAQSQAPNSAPPPPAAPPIATAAPGASLDAVFAGAQVNPSDARAASRLAGAFSGTPGAQSRTPPTPPTPTPRVNPRLPHAQESEEDVAKFRAWLDGLTGE